MNETDVNHYIVRKVSAFIRAVYLVTDLLPHQEPMRWGLRAGVVEIARLVTVNLSNTSTVASAVYRQVSDQLLNFLTLVDAARHSQLVSAMNVKVITDEVQKFIQELQRFTQSSLDQGVHLDSALFFVQGNERQTSNMSFTSDSVSLMNRQENHEGHAQSHTKEASHGAGYHHEQKHEKTHISPAHQHHVSKQVSHHNSSQSKTKTPPNYERRVKVLAYLSKQRKASIPEITTFVGGVSDKTIQRELQGLIEEGAVVREGDRRWARYSLVA